VGHPSKTAFRGIPTNCMTCDSQTDSFIDSQMAKHPSYKRVTGPRFKS
jgi:hypothetical protein